MTIFGSQNRPRAVLSYPTNVTLSDRQGTAPGAATGWPTGNGNRARGRILFLSESPCRFRYGNELRWRCCLLQLTFTFLLPYLCSRKPPLITLDHAQRQQARLVRKKSGMGEMDRSVQVAAAVAKRTVGYIKCNPVNATPFLRYYVH